jgi:hypothetical protein
VSTGFADPNISEEAGFFASSLSFLQKLKESLNNVLFHT